MVTFKYEKLCVSCFACGHLGHTEQRCPVLFAKDHDDGVREWSIELRAEPRKQGGGSGSRWLKEEGRNRPTLAGGRA